MSESPITNHEPRTTNHEDDEISLLDLAIVLAKHKRLILGLPFLAALLAAGYSLLLPNIYTGTTKILPPQQHQSAAAAMLNQFGTLASLAGQSVGIRNPNDLYVGMLKSRTVADNLIARFELDKLYNAQTADHTRRALERSTKITSGKDGLITVEFEDQDPKRAANVANGYVEELYKLTQVLAVTEASHRRLFFEKQLKLTRDNLAQAELAFKQTQEATGLIRLDDQGKAIIEAVARLQAQVASKEVQVTAMRTFATQQNPDLIVAQQELAGLRTQLAKVEREQNLGSGNILVPTGKVPEVGLEYLRKFRDVKYFETIFEFLAKQYEVAKIDEARDASMIQVLDKAIVPNTRSRPARTQIVVVTAFVFGLLAVLLVLFIEVSRRLRADPQQAERLDLLRRYVWGK